MSTQEQAGGDMSLGKMWWMAGAASAKKNWKVEDPTTFEELGDSDKVFTEDAARGFLELARSAPEAVPAGGIIYIPVPDGSNLDGTTVYLDRAAAEEMAQSMRGASVREFREVGQPAEPSQGRECWVLYSPGGALTNAPAQKNRPTYHGSDGYKWVRVREVVEPQERGEK